MSYEFARDYVQSWGYTMKISSIDGEGLIHPALYVPKTVWVELQTSNKKFVFDEYPRYITKVIGIDE